MQYFSFEKMIEKDIDGNYPEIVVGSIVSIDESGARLYRVIKEKDNNYVDVECVNDNVVNKHVHKSVFNVLWCDATQDME